MNDMVYTHTQAMPPTPPPLEPGLGGREALVDELEEVGVLQRRQDPLLVVELLVHRLLRAVAALGELHADLEPGRKNAHDLGPDAQADQGRHRAVGDRRGEEDVNGAPGVVHLDVVVGNNPELLQRVRVLCEGETGQKGGRGLVGEDVESADARPSPTQRNSPGSAMSRMCSNTSIESMGSRSTAAKPLPENAA